MNTKPLQRAAKRLQPDQGRIARGNARRAVLAELKKLRVELDRDFPPIRKSQKGKRARLSPSTWRARMKKRGYKPLGNEGLVRKLKNLAAVGVRIHREPQFVVIKATEPEHRDHWVPIWAWYAADDLKRLRKLKKAHHRERLAFLVEVAMSEDDEYLYGPK